MEVSIERNTVPWHAWDNNGQGETPFGREGKKNNLEKGSHIILEAMNADIKFSIMSE